jgi:predicted nucleic acid-binding protein
MTDGPSRGYLLDTETCAAILRRSNPAVMERLSRVAVGEVSISAVTLSELMYGVEVSRRTAQDRAAMEVFLRHVAVLEYPSAAAEHYGMVRMVLELCAVPGDDAGVGKGAGDCAGAWDGGGELELR